MFYYNEEYGAQGAQGSQGSQGSQSYFDGWVEIDSLRQWNCPRCKLYFDWDATPLVVAQYIDDVPGIPHITCPSCQRCMGCKH